VRINENKAALAMQRQGRTSSTNIIQTDVSTMKEENPVSWEAVSMILTKKLEAQFQEKDAVPRLNITNTISTNTVGSEIASFLRKVAIPIINIEINKTEVKAILDTGSVISIISEEVFKKLNIPLHAWNIGELKVADGRKITPIGIVRTNVFLAKTIVPLEMAVIKEINVPCILGADFNEEAGVTFDFKNKRLVLNKYRGNKKFI